MNRDKQTNNKQQTTNNKQRSAFGNKILRRAGGRSGGDEALILISVTYQTAGLHLEERLRCICALSMERHVQWEPEKILGAATHGFVRCTFNIF
jgi:hypothetical protein